MSLFNLTFEKNNEYNKLLKNLDKTPKNFSFTGLFSSAKSHIITHINKNSLVICEDEASARSFFNDLSFFAKDRVFYYPVKDAIFYTTDIKSLDIIKNRFKVINEIFNRNDIIVVTSVEALFDPLVKSEIFKNFILSFKVGQEINLEELTQKLIFMGYEKAEDVEVQGKFAIRGGIIDIFSPVMDNAFRLELWGDEIDSIRILDSLSQRSINKIENVKIYPMRELVYTQKELDFCIKNIENDLKNTLDLYKKDENLEKSKKIEQRTNYVLEKLKNEKTFSGIDKYIKYFYKNTVSILEYFPKDTVIYFNENSRIEKNFKIKREEFLNIASAQIYKGEALEGLKDTLFSYNEIVQFSINFNNIFLSNFTKVSSEHFNIDKSINFNVKNIAILKNNYENFFDEIYYYKKLNYKILLLVSNRTKCEKLHQEFNIKGITSVLLLEEGNLDKNYDLKDGVVYILRGALSEGIEYPDEKFVIITENEFFVQEHSKKKKKKFKGKKIESFSELNFGDYIVHETYGIGIFCGIEKVVTDGITKDYLKLEYDGGSSLYVPINQMDVVQKYIAAGANLKPKLNKLGGKGWEKSTSKVKSQVKVLAKDLIKLYAKRQESKGFAYSKDNIWQKEFEDSFPYEETTDQLNAISDVKFDMESKKAMDRLICGDVGFGKTEVAIRAIFKAVQDSKQVAFLVPTTILAQQHYNNFIERMKNYPINIQILSRFRTPKQQKETIKNLENGIADVVIGTHRILSGDIKFRDLGLIVIDEEQRFGVSHKEKLKSIKENVDVLTLSATPIPRTLHMSMTGIRDMSILEEAPQKRIPVQTYVLEYEEEIIKTAINREVSRGGQVYYLYNKVNSIEEETKKIQNLLPNLKISFAHGQMSERELEKIVMEFIENKINVLVCTTIIETGLDIPNVNTIIIQDADTMGLSQLYQLRGRVGRSDRTSIAYLMYKRDKVLKEVSEKRLQVIRDFTEFGSGFKIAMRDLEIRGAGNILGAEQHGHMDLIGYEMYCKLLEQAISELKGEDQIIDFETTIDIAINAFIPPSYIENQMHKLEMYKKITLIKNIEDFYDIQDELEDRFGNIPKFVQNLLDIALMKSYAHKVGVLSINQRRDKINIIFKEDNNANIDTLVKLISSNKNLSFNGVLTYKIEQDKNPVLELQKIFEKIS